MNGEAFDVAIIGAGHNGLVAAGYLARAGLRVVVLERRDIVGGAVTTEELIPGLPLLRLLVPLLRAAAARSRPISSCGGTACTSTSSSRSRCGRFPTAGTSSCTATRRGMSRPFGRSRSTTPRRIRAGMRSGTAPPSIVNPYRLRTPPTLAQLFDDVRGTDLEPVLELLVTKSLRRPARRMVRVGRP